MRRKVVKHGTATLTVSLPSKWVKQYNVKAGEELEVVPTGKDLRISIQKEPVLKKTELTLSREDARTIDKILKNFYRAGYNEIKINFQRNESLMKVKQVLGVLIGFEVVEQSSKSCLIQNVSPNIQLDFDTVFRKCFRLILLEYDFLLQNINTKQREQPEIFEQMNHDLNKFTYLCQRMLFQSPSLSPELQTSYYTLLSKLLRTSRNCVEMYKLLFSKKRILSREVVLYLKDAQKLFNDSYQAIFQHDLSKLEELDARKTRLYDVFYRRIQRQSGFENLIFHHLYDNIRLTGVFSPLPIMAEENVNKSKLFS